MSDRGTFPEGEQTGKAKAAFRWYARDFERRAMVAWFNPYELAATGARALMASMFGSYADKRDVMGLGADAEVCSDLQDRDEVWIDYIADLGDGWASTYSMAWLTARERLEKGSGLTIPESLDGLPRGDLLVLGGDEVYPTATREEYHHRFVGPYTAALPFVNVNRGDVPPLMFAIPGNHDWYDGLASFTRLFCQRRWIGGRKTSQTRSYFAIQLPHDWWLWGIDTQLHADLDQPQLDYFRRVVTGQLTEGKEVDGFFEGKKVILCVPSPEWVATADEEKKGERQRLKRGVGPYTNLDFLERQVIEKHGGELAVTLTGDIHHYAHYVESTRSAQRGGREPQHKITAGGGGAYTRAAHRLPPELTLGEDRRVYELGATFPDEKDSRRLVKKASLAFVTKKANWPLAGFQALLYLWFAWIVQSTSKMLDPSAAGYGSFMEQALASGLADVGTLLREFWRIAAHGPSVALTALLVIGALMTFSRASDKKFRPIHYLVGGLHGVSHILLALAAMWGFAKVNMGVLSLDVDAPLQTSLFVVEMFGIGGLAGALLMGSYLAFANSFLGLNDNEVLSCQSDEDFKNFVRMRLGPDGLTLYPIGVRTVLRADDWEKTALADQGELSPEAWWKPAGSRTLAAELLSSADFPSGIHIPGRASPPGQDTSNG